VTAISEYLKQYVDVFCLTRGIICLSQSYVSQESKVCKALSKASLLWQWYIMPSCSIIYCVTRHQSTFMHPVQPGTNENNSCSCLHVKLVEQNVLYNPLHHMGAGKTTMCSWYLIQCTTIWDTASPLAIYPHQPAWHWKLGYKTASRQ